MRTTIYLISAVLCLCQVLTAQNGSKNVREKVIGRTTDVLFDGKSKELSAQLEKFETETNAKLHYKVQQESINQIGGLAEYIFKIYQSISSPINNEASTIVGEFSFLKNEKLSDTVSYRTIASADLLRCKFPSEELEKFDRDLNATLMGSQKSGNSFQELPIIVDEYLHSSTENYSNICARTWLKCNNDTGLVNTYGQHVAHTRSDRAVNWNQVVLDLTLKVLELEDTQIPGTTSTATLSSLSPNVKHVASLNNLLSSCSLDDLNNQGEILYRHTGIHFYYLTEYIDFYIPRDSLQLLVDQVSERLFNYDRNAKFIVGLWVQMKDKTDGSSCNTLLVAQNGNYINSADVNFARYNNASNYKNAAYYVFNAIYKNITKPLIICYQVLKANGLVTTTYLRKPNLVKGANQIYVHVLKHDERLDDLNALQQKITEALVQADDCPTCVKIDITILYAEKRNLQAECIVNPILVEAKSHFKQKFLINTSLANKAAHAWINEKFSNVYHNTIVGALVDYADGAEGYQQGSCDKAVDVVMDVLSISSLLLSPVNLDFIPDALTVAYCISKDDYDEAATNAVFLFAPGNMQAAKRVLHNTSEMVDAINHGARILSEGGVYKAIDAEQELILRSYRIPSSMAPNLPAEIATDIVRSRELITAEQAAMQRIVDELPVEKRMDFIHEFMHNKQFSQNCMESPAEVWRWANKIEEINGIKRAEFLTSVSEFTNPAIGEKAWYLFSNKKFKELEEFFVKEKINGQYPPADGFLSIINKLACKALEGMMFDRYQNSSSLYGYYASPIMSDGSSYSMSSRSLKPTGTYTHKIKFKILDGCKSNLMFVIGDAIKWFGESGGAMQIKSSIPFDKLTEGIDYMIIEVLRL